MKNYQIFSIIFIIFAGLLFGTGCKPKVEPGPGDLPEYKALSDDFFIGVTPLDGYEGYTEEYFAVHCAVKKYLEDGGQSSNFSSRRWPAVSIEMENKDSPDFNEWYYDQSFKEDSKGFYIIVKKGEQILLPMIKTPPENYMFYNITATGDYTYQNLNWSPEYAYSDYIECYFSFDPQDMWENGS